MVKRVPQKSDFDIAQIWDKWNCKVRWAIGIISLVPIALLVLKIENECVDKAIGLVLLILAIINIYTKFKFTESFRKAEATRRNGFLDNVFGTKLADIESSGYYDTDEIGLGYRKLLANLHENSIYSNRIGKKMYDKSERTLLVGIIGLAIITITNFVGMQAGVALVDLFIAAEIIDEYRCLKAFTVETEKVIEECKMIWESGKLGKQPNNKILAQIMKAYIHYESTLAYASVILDSDIYNELNESLEEEWEEIKKRYNMKG